MRKVLLPNIMTLHPDLPEGWSAVVVDGNLPIPPEHRDAVVLVACAASTTHLRSAATTMPRLRLVQSLSSGVDDIIAAGFRDDVRIATGTGLHDDTVAEHTLALLLALVRSLPTAGAAQHRHEWSAELTGIRELHPAGQITTLRAARVLIWGFGSIGHRLAPLLHSLGAQVTGVARTAGRRGGFPVITAGDLPEHLPTTDILIGILPGTAQTRQVIGADVFAALPRRALVVNVGRGTTLDQVALAGALHSGSIAGAAIDVTDPEPLPAADPLWDAPGLIITPHSAGGRPVGADERIVANIAALEAGTPLRHQAR